MDATDTTPDTTHECPAPGCEHRVARHQYACSTCWFKLPYRIRQRMSAAYRRDTAAHRAAMADAATWYAAHAGVRT